MSIVLDYNEIGKGFNYNGTVYNLYGAMFDPGYNPQGTRNEFNAVDTFYSVDLAGFQQGNEVCVYCITVWNNGSASESYDLKMGFEQRNGSSRVRKIPEYSYHDTLASLYQNAYWTWVGVDPDEIRPGISEYRFYATLNGQTTYKTMAVTGLSFDTTPHPAGYLRVEGINLCYVPPCYYSGSSSTGYKHIIKPDGYSGGNVGTDKAGYIRIPSSSSDHHIYYVNEYGIVNRTAESYEWSGGSSSAGSNKGGYIRMTPSTSSVPEQQGYNYLCYVDGGNYKRRMGVGEI